MQNNIVVGGADPLLDVGKGYQSRNSDDEIARMSEMQQMLEQKKMEMEQSRSQITSPQQIRTPIWDEIDKLISEMSDREVEYLNGSSEFADSNQKVLAILQREQLRIMRPIVEGTKDGKEALESHLNLVKRLKKDAANENNKAMDLFKEYTENYPDISYSEFLKMKRNK